MDMIGNGPLMGPRPFDPGIRPLHDTFSNPIGSLNLSTNRIGLDNYFARQNNLSHYTLRKDPFSSTIRDEYGCARGYIDPFSNNTFKNLY